MGTDVNKPHPTILASKRYTRIIAAIVSNFQYNNEPKSVDQPIDTLLASRRHQYLINAELSQIDNSKIIEGDSEYTELIKKFMQAYCISDIKMRMLRVDELKKIQGFPENYILDGNQTIQKKFIGNSVVPIVAMKIIEKLYQDYYE